ncbi:MAG: hypothetical protein IPM79_22955 [Polyangiaceae bacterium]|nr:hypothetical protein [Polyangiaceae bacterium]
MLAASAASRGPSTIMSLWCMILFTQRTSTPMASSFPLLVAARAALVVAFRSSLAVSKMKRTFTPRFTASARAAAMPASE